MARASGLSTEDVRPVELLGVFLYVVVDEKRNVFRPLAERRDGDPDGAQPIIEIVPEMASLDIPLQVAMGGGNDPDVRLERFFRPQGRKISSLQHMQQLGLERQRHVPDLVEEQHPAVGLLELAPPRADGAGECAPLVAEHFALEQGIGQGGAVHLDEGLPQPVGPLVEFPNDQFFAYAGFPADDHVEAGLGDLFDEFPYSSNVLADADKFVICFAKIHTLPHSKIRANMSSFPSIVKYHSNSISYISHAAPQRDCRPQL